MRQLHFVHNKKQAKFCVASSSKAISICKIGKQGSQAPTRSRVAFLRGNRTLARVMDVSTLYANARRCLLFAESNLTQARWRFRLLRSLLQDTDPLRLSESATSALAPFLGLISAVKTYLSCVSADKRTARPVAVASKALLRARRNNSISVEGLRQASLPTRSSQVGALHVNVNTPTGLKLRNLDLAEPRITCYAKEYAKSSLLLLNATSTVVYTAADSSVSDRTS